MYDTVSLANTGSTGNNAGTSVHVGAYRALALQFVVEAAGATPTVTYKFQGSMDNTNWYDVGYITDSSDSIAVATSTRTTTGAEIKYLSNPTARKFKYVRCVVTGNTNVTYRAEAYLMM